MRCTRSMLHYVHICGVLMLVISQTRLPPVWSLPRAHSARVTAALTRLASFFTIAVFSPADAVGHRPISEAVRPHPMHHRVPRSSWHTPVQGDGGASIGSL